MDNNRNNNNQNDNGNRNRQSLIIFLVCLMVGLIGMSLFSGMLDTSTSRKITYDKFLEMLENKEIKSVTIKNTSLEIEPNAKTDETGSITYHTTMTEDETALTERLAKDDVEFSKEETSVISGYLLTFERIYNLLCKVVKSDNVTKKLKIMINGSLAVVWFSQLHVVIDLHCHIRIILLFCLLSIVRWQR